MLDGALLAVRSITAAFFLSISQIEFDTSAMSWEDDSSSEFSMGIPSPGEEMNRLVPWKEAFGYRVVTSSPVRKGCYICMDPSCPFHDEDGKGTKDHNWTSKATALEQVVLNAFSGVDPADLVGTREFDGWTSADLHFACNSTYCAYETRKYMFGEGATAGPAASKLRSFVSTFEKAALVYEENHNKLEVDVKRAIFDCIKNWSGGMHPLMFLYTMKARNDTLTAKVLRMRNTVDVWKWEAEKATSEVKRLKTKIKLLKKELE